MPTNVADPRHGYPLRVLVVEDSLFFRAQLVRLLAADPDFVVVGEAGTGHEAVAKAQALRPDLVTMDVEMPEMDGISAVREIMRTAPTAIMMLSALTRSGADATFAALEAGAADFLAKQSLQDATRGSTLAALRQRLKNLARGGVRQPASAPRTVAAAAGRDCFSGRSLLVIGASTGGPALVAELLSAVATDLPCPVLVVMHMPAGYTRYFAQRIDRNCRLTVAEAAAGSTLERGLVLVAPGGCQTLLVRGAKLSVEVTAAEPEDIYKPCIDSTFESAAHCCGDGALAVVLTGMGNDGTAGCRALRAVGGTVWAQDEASSVIDGMPAAVRKAGLANDVVSAAELRRRLERGT